jgi:hypothetical protein
MNRKRARVIYASIGAAIVATAAWIGSGDPDDLEATQLATADSTISSAGGDVALDSASSPISGFWISDRGIIAAASELQIPPQDAARIQLRAWISDSTARIAVAILADHAALRGALDTLAQALDISPARPAIADSRRARYDAQTGKLLGLPARELERRFIATQIESHGWAIQDLRALAGLARDPEVRAMLLSRGAQLEELHLAMLEQRQQAIATADSIAQAAREARMKRGRGR